METSGLVRIKKFIINGKQLHTINSMNNAIEYDKNHYLFTKKDPMIVILLDDEKSLVLQIEYDIIDYDISTSNIKSYYCDKILYKNKEIEEKNKLIEELQKEIEKYKVLK